VYVSGVWYVIKDFREDFSLSVAIYVGP